MTIAAPVLLLLILLTSSPLVAADGDLIFLDGFSSGDMSFWSNYTLPAEAFRITRLELRDPHLFVEALGIFCVDVTESELNGSVQDAIDFDADADGLLDYSLLLNFRPLDQQESDARLDLQRADCTYPAATTSCSPTPGAEPVLAHYGTAGEGICLEALPGTTRPYSPPVAEPSAPCFVTQPTPVSLSLAGLELDFEAAQAAATFDADPAQLANGLILGFVSEADADAAIIDPEVPLIGGLPLSSLWPGGSGNCAGGDDRDLHDGVLGWWFYFNFDAARVPYSD